MDFWVSTLVPVSGRSFTAVIRKSIPSRLLKFIIKELKSGGKINEL